MTQINTETALGPERLAALRKLYSTAIAHCTECGERLTGGDYCIKCETHQSFTPDESVVALVDAYTDQQAELDRLKAPVDVEGLRDEAKGLYEAGCPWREIVSHVASRLAACIAGFDEPANDAQRRAIDSVLNGKAKSKKTKTV